MFENMDFLPGKIVFFDFAINSKQPLDENNWDLKEDMLQVEYPNNFLLDIGWYHGSFGIHIIKEYNWEKPVIKKSCKTLEKLEIIVQDCVNKVRILIEKENNVKNKHKP